MLERNQKRLADCGIPLSDNISDTMPIDVVNVLKANNTTPGGITGIGPIEPFGHIMTNPAWPVIDPPVPADGIGGTRKESVVLYGGVAEQTPEFQTNTQGDVKVAQAVWKLKFGDHDRNFL